MVEEARNAAVLSLRRNSVTETRRDPSLVSKKRAWQTGLFAHVTIEVAPIICELRSNGDNTTCRRLAVISVYMLLSYSVYIFP